MKIEIWSDIVCPFCYIGKRHMEAALARFGQRDEVEVEWRSFELDPSAPRERAGDLADHLAAKYGGGRERALGMMAQMSAQAKESGLDFRLDKAILSNTFDAHRLLHLAARHGLQDAAKERLLASYQCRGEHIGDHAALRAMMQEVGLSADEVDAVLNGDAYTAEVRADEQEAQQLGIRGVPFFVIDRKYAISGAQPIEVMLGALNKAWAERGPRIAVLAGGDSAGQGDCSDGQCAL